MCAGCGAPVVVRQILRALKPEDHAVIGSATGCLGGFYIPISIYSMEGFIYSQCI